MEKSIHCHMHASSHNSAHLSSWPKSHWASSEETGRTGLLLSHPDSSQMESCAVTSAVFRGSPWGNEHCSHSAQHNYPDVSLIIVKPNSFFRQLIVALKGKRPQNNNWPLTIKEEFAWIMSLDFLAIYWQYHSFVSDLENILQLKVSMEISDC